MNSDAAPLLDLEEVMEPGLWAMWCAHPSPEVSRRHPDCPRTGWVHEGGQPYRVIVSEDPFELPRPGGMVERVPYTGSEPTVHFRDWMRI